LSLPASWNRERYAAYAAGAAVAACLVSIALSQILLATAILLTLPSWRHAEYPRGAWLLLLFFALTLASAFAHGDPAVAWPQIRKFYVYLVVPSLAAAVSGHAFVRNTLAAAGAAGLASAFWSLVQYGRKYAAARQAGLDFSQAYVADRITGFMSHWQTFSGEMMILFLAAAAFVLFHRPVRWRVAASAALFGLALLLAQTRGMWIGAFAGALYLLWSWRKPFILAAPLLACLVFVAGPQSARDRLVSIVRPRGETDSNSHRIALLRTGLEMAAANPWLGVGPERVERNFERYAPPDIPRPFPRSWWYGHLHNIYLQFAADRGLPAMAAIALFLFWNTFLILLAAAKAPADTRWMLHAIAAASLAMLVTGLFEHNLGDSEVLLLYLGLLTLGASLAGKSRAPEKTA
jgi:putative inorganic carbon (hco3(-)) transporter